MAGTSSSRKYHGHSSSETQSSGNGVGQLFGCAGVLLVVGFILIVLSSGVIR